MLKNMLIFLHRLSHCLQFPPAQKMELLLTGYRDIWFGYFIQGFMLMLCLRCVRPNRQQVLMEKYSLSKKIQQLIA